MVLSCGVCFLVSRLLHANPGLDRGQRRKPAATLFSGIAVDTAIGHLVQPRLLSSIRTRAKRSFATLPESESESLHSLCSAATSAYYPYCTYTLAGVDGSGFLLNLSNLAAWQSLGRDRLSEDEPWTDSLLHFVPLVQYADQHDSVWTRNWTRSADCLFRGSVQSLQNPTESQLASQPSSFFPVILNLCGGMVSGV